MKRHKGITNPWALAWWMHGQGAQPRKKVATEVTLEGGAGSGRHSTDYAKHAAAAGAKFNGIQSTPKGHQFVVITDNKTGSTGMIPVKGATPKAIADHVQQIRQRFGHTSEGGPGSGRVVSKFAPEHHDDEDKATQKFTRREKPAQRAARIRAIHVPADRAAVIKKAFGSEGEMGNMRDQSTIKGIG